MTGSVSAYNQVQKIPTIGAQGVSTDATPIYTVPTGKKSVVTFNYVPIAIGASANVVLVVNGVNLDTMVAADFTAQTKKTISFQLAAGKEFHFHGNVADNATLNWSYSIQESVA